MTANAQVSDYASEHLAQPCPETPHPLNQQGDDVRRKVWFHRTRAACWAIAYPVTVALGVADSVALVWFASAYANALTDWSAAEAADDTAVMRELTELRAEVRQVRALLVHVLEDRDS